MLGISAQDHCPLLKLQIECTNDIACIYDSKYGCQKKTDKYQNPDIVMVAEKPILVDPVDPGME